MERKKGGATLIVGALNHELGYGLIADLAARGERLTLLARMSERGDAEAIRAAIGGGVDLLFGDPSAIDLGLSGTEYRALRAEASAMHWFIEGYAPKVSDARAPKAAEECLEFASDAPSLKRITVWSSALASGRTEGILKEEPFSRLTKRQATRQGRKQSSGAIYEADQVFSEALASFPMTLVRTGSVVLAPQLGSKSILNGAGVLILYLLARRSEPILMMPGRADALLNFLPADFVYRAERALSLDERTLHRVIHLVDSDPPTVRRAISILCALMGRPAPRFYAPPAAAAALLQSPGLRREGDPTRTLLEEMSSRLVIDASFARSILDEAGLVCPAFESYAEATVEEMRERVGFAPLRQVSGA